MKNVLILSLIYSPDNVSTAQIMAGLAEDLLKAGNRVKVLTTTPHFHRDASMEAKQLLTWCMWPILKKSELNGVTAYHVPMPDKSIWPPLRMLSWIWFHALSVILMPFLGKTDVIIACSPPLTIGLAAWAMSVVGRCKYVYNVQELYPDIAVNLGKMKGAAIIHFFQQVERFIYRHSAAVTSITEGMCKKIRQRVDPSKVYLIPNYVEIEAGTGQCADYASQTVKRLNDQTITLCYAGNMGVPQNLGVLIEAARILKEKGENVRFVFAGGGQDEARLKMLARGLDNVAFYGYLPLSMMPQIYAESDVFYVGQDPKASGDGIPSKIYRILGQKKPLIVVTSSGSDLAAFVTASGGGWCVNDANEMARLLIDLRGQPDAFSSRGGKGFNYVKANFTRSQVTKEYARLVAEL